MLQQLISHSPDLKRLIDEGYDIETNGGLLIAHHIPYVTSTKEVKYGKLVCSLTLAGPNRTGRPQDHTIYFSGEIPCDANGTILTAIINNSKNQQLAEGLVVNHYFSSKPTSGQYSDYYEKIRTYSEILSAQAREINYTVTPKPNSKKSV